MTSRSTQTDASSFNYISKRKRDECIDEEPKIFDKERDVSVAWTQTEWSAYADVLIDNKKSPKKYNLRRRKK